ncbi:MAG: NAD(P)-dependent oxidoreductase [Thermoleophilia bacterium]|nr:NAD(P)-dependent oxidoreductase [Thermoleophilia bacterium]
MTAPGCTLVTGALGCLGAWTIRELHREGTPVVGFDLGTDAYRLRELMDAGDVAALTLARGDITSRDELARVLDEHEITHVIHLAALQIPFCRADPIRGALVNVVGTLNVLEAVKERRERIAGPVVYASSAAYWGLSDAEAAASHEAARSRPDTHYGVYKQANEGNARIYWQDAGLSSLGLRPANVYGPARDQGVTSEPTHAMRAAARGEGYHINYGGRTVFNYTADVARALVRMSRAAFEGAAAFNMPGTPGHMRELVAAIEAAAPDVAGRITFDDTPLPVPADLATDGLAGVIGAVELTPLPDAVRATVEHFRRTAT